MELFEALRSRSSVRDYLPVPLSPRELEGLQEAALLAPTSLNLQEQKFDPHQAPEEEQPPADEPDDFSDINSAAVRTALENGEPSAFVNQVMQDVERAAAAQETAPDGQALFPFE